MGQGILAEESLFPSTQGMGYPMLSVQALSVVSNVDIQSQSHEGKAREAFYLVSIQSAVGQGSVSVIF